MVETALVFPHLDYRKRMKRAGWTIGTRKRTRYFVVHYNGPPVRLFGSEAGEIAQLQFDSGYHMRPDVLRADGIQYHGATLSNGLNLQLRDWNTILWHCGNKIGNLEGISWHLPLGGAQHPTPVQLHSLFGVVIPVFMRHYNIVFTNVLGHKELKATQCPGNIFPHLQRWRDERATLPRLLWFRTLVNVNVRQSPEIAGVVVTTIPANTVFAVSAIVSGTAFNGITSYLHRADGLGFMLNDPRLVKQE